jgi:hypothetical protein
VTILSKNGWEADIGRQVLQAESRLAVYGLAEGGQATGVRRQGDCPVQIDGNQKLFWTRVVLDKSDNSTLKRLLSLLILAALAGLLHSFRTGASLTDGLGNGCQRAERIPERQRILGRRSMEPIRGEQFRAIAHY